MLTIQSNNIIRINKGDTGIAPLFINIGDSLRPIGYQFALPVKVTTTPELTNMVFYEDSWRSNILDAGNYSYHYDGTQWTDKDGEVVEDITKLGFVFPKEFELPSSFDIQVEYNLLDNDSYVIFDMWPVLQDPEVPLLQKIIIPKENKVLTIINGTEEFEEHINTVNSYGEILLQFDTEDTISFERGKYLYQLRANLWNEYGQKMELKTIINRTYFYIIDDNFSQRIW